MSTLQDRINLYELYEKHFPILHKFIDVKITKLFETQISQNTQKHPKRDKSVSFLEQII